MAEKELFILCETHSLMPRKQDGPKSYLRLGVSNVFVIGPGRFVFESFS
jgi:hypothetical protein